jgi:hypothetical protein
MRINRRTLAKREFFEGRLIQVCKGLLIGRIFSVTT